MSVLQPLIDKGTIVVKSGQMGMDKVGTLRWDGAVAQARMDNILSANYSDGSRVDGVLAPYDGLSRGIISSLRGVGYGTPTSPGRSSPARTPNPVGQGDHRRRAVFDRVQGHARTRQGHRRPGRRRALGRQGRKINDTKTYNNGVKVVPSYLLIPVSVDKSNYEDDRGRLGLHQGRRAEVSVCRAAGARAIVAGPFRSHASSRV